MKGCQVAIVGSGFAGTILARILHSQRWQVVLLERRRHPRFAIGESSTPLAAICLERLASKYGLSDLVNLAAYGRWMERMPEVRRGLKRGFTFYRHRPGQEFVENPGNENRLLVAASPDDAVADSHWLRADVDHHLVRLAMAEGVDYRDCVQLETLRPGRPGAWVLSGQDEDRAFELAADIIIDGSGEGGFLAAQLPIESDLDQVELDTSLVFSHFEELGPPPELSPGPYPDQRAAVHHLLDEGWMYVLPFDHGVASAGIVLRRQAMEELVAAGHDTPSAIWRQVIGRYPTLARQFDAAKPLRPLELYPRVQRRLAEASGENWALLPHTYTFLDPMFSTGIAWSLLAVERLSGIFGAAAGEGDGSPDLDALSERLHRYGRQLSVEAQHVSTLLEGAYLAMKEMDLFVAQSFLYFATVSFEEVDQRLSPEGRAGIRPAWRGFLGSGDARLESVFAESTRRLGQMFDGTPREPRAKEREDFVNWIVEVIASRNIAGLGEPSRRNLYPVDLDLLVERADLLGLTPHEMRLRLPLLRGIAGPS